MTLPIQPTTEVPMIDEANDTGKWVVSALSKRSEALGQCFLEAAGWYTVNDICTIFSETTGRRLKFQEVSESDFIATNGEEVCEAWILLRDFAYFGPGAKEKLETSLKVGKVIYTGCECADYLYYFKFLDQKATTLQEYLVSSGPW